MNLRQHTAHSLQQPLVPATRVRLQELDRPPMSVRWTDDEQPWRDQAARIRRETHTDMPGFIDQFVASVERAGGVVHLAATAADACHMVAEIGRQHQATVVTKTKSMATEEIGLNAHLEREGFTVVETDLGEHIIQLRGETPSQLVGPALHLSAEDVADTFSALGEDVSNDPESLAASARARLRQQFRDADTGTLVLVTNEGNADMVTSHPAVLVAVVGIDKIIPRLADIATLVPILCRAAADHEVTTYQTMLTGPRREGEPDGPDELHVVLLDNGRSALLGTPFSEALACIRCGNCQMMCPVFKALGGGHGYGTVYGGPIGAVLSPLLGDPDEHRELPFLSSLCGACADACPVKIPLPDLLVQLRTRYQDQRTDATGQVERTGWELFARAWSNSTLYQVSIMAARAAGRLLPRPLLAAFPMARQWATGRQLPHLEWAGEWRRWLRRPNQKGDQA